MDMNPVNSVYSHIDISTSNPLRIVLMLYDGAINFLNKAIGFAEQGDIKQKNIYANKARDIIQELNNALNTDAGQDLARHLRSLYLFLNRHLMSANWNNDMGAMKEVVDILTHLREAWQAAYQQNESGKPAPPGTGDRPSCLTVH
jgi:flagellar protein FliS